MASRSCVSGCGHFLSSSDGDDRCPPCLGYQHAEAALVDLAHPCLYYYLLSPQYTVLHILFYCTFNSLLFLLIFIFYLYLYIYSCVVRAVTVADFYHRGGNGPTTAGGAVL